MQQRQQIVTMVSSKIERTENFKYLFCSIIFMVHYSSSSQEECGGTQTGSNGELLSPNYPQDYHDHSLCEWTITVPEDRIVLIRFTAFSLEAHGSCSYDFLAIDVDGDGVDNNDIRFCGTEFYSLISYQMTVSVTFDSDYSITSSGFNITWESVKQNNGHIYMGCFKDSSRSRTMPHGYIESGDMTIDKCRQHCYDIGHWYSGLQYSVQCFCGDEYYGERGQRSENECDMACSGNAEEICGGSDRNSVYVSGGVVEVTTIQLTTEGTTIQPTIEIICTNHLGVKDIPISRMTASSTFNNDTVNFGPHRGRLDTLDENNGPEGGWKPGTDDQNQWIQVDLCNVTEVSGVITQGRKTEGNEWVKSYNVFYSVDGFNFSQALPAVDEVFNGNINKNSKVTNMLRTPVEARYVRINPITWNNYPSMRFEVLGCLTHACEGWFI